MSKHDLFGVNPLRLTHAVGMTRRDRRIDFLRGMAVLAISANHIWPLSGSEAQYPYPAYKFGHIFAFDFADVFLLLSGIVAGIVFFPLLVQQGLRKCYERSLRRAGQIWGAHVLCVFASLSIVLIFERELSMAGLPLSPFGQSVFEGFSKNLLLYNPSIFLDILPIYIGLLLVLPLALAVLRYSAPLFIVTTVSIWALIWVPIHLAEAGIFTLPSLALKTPFFIHPFAAQLLFFIGIFIGAHKYEIETFIAAHSRKILIASSVLLIVTNYISQMAWTEYDFGRKYYLNPLRLVDLLAVMMVIWCLVKPFTLSAEKTNVIEACGRHILPAFAVTTVGAVFFTYLNHWLDAGRVVYGLCIFANVTLCLVIGHVLEKRRTSSFNTSWTRSPTRQPGLDKALKSS